MGEELFAASAYLAREPLMLGGLKGQDLIKVIIILFILLGTLMTTTGLYSDWIKGLFVIC